MLICHSSAAEPSLPFLWSVPPLEKSKFSCFWSRREASEQCLWAQWCSRVSNPTATPVCVEWRSQFCALRWALYFPNWNGASTINPLQNCFCMDYKFLMLSDMRRVVVCSGVQTWKSSSVLHYPFWTRSRCATGPTFYLSHVLVMFLREILFEFWKHVVCHWKLKLKRLVTPNSHQNPHV